MARGPVKPPEQVKVSWLNVRLTAAERAELDARALAESTPERRVTATDLARRGLMAVLGRGAEMTPAAPARQ